MRGKPKVGDIVKFPSARLYVVLSIKSGMGYLLRLDNGARRKITETALWYDMKIVGKISDLEKVIYNINEEDIK